MCVCMCTYIFSKNLLVYYFNYCIYYFNYCTLIGYATRYLFVNRYRVAASINARQGRKRHFKPLVKNKCVGPSIPPILSSTFQAHTLATNTNFPNFRDLNWH